MEADARAVALWARMFGLFGAEAVSRKFDSKPPPEWVEQIAKLRDFELDRGIRRLTFSGRAYVPTLPEFLKLCRAVEDQADGNSPQATPLRLEAPPDHDYDHWDATANQKFHRHVNQPGRARKLCVVIEGRHHCDRELLRPYLDHKRMWAAEMRDAASERTLPQSGDDSWWDDRMRRADEEVEHLLAARNRDVAA